MTSIDVHGRGHVRVNRKAKENKIMVGKNKNLEFWEFGDLLNTCVRMKGRQSSLFRWEEVSDFSGAGPQTPNHFCVCLERREK